MLKFTSRVNNKKKLLYCAIPVLINQCMRPSPCKSNLLLQDCGPITKAIHQTLSNFNMNRCTAWTLCFFSLPIYHSLDIFSPQRPFGIKHVQAGTKVSRISKNSIRKHRLHSVENKRMAIYTSKQNYLSAVDIPQVEKFSTVVQSYEG